MIQIDNLIPYVYFHRFTILTDRQLLTHLISDPTHPTIAVLLNIPISTEMTWNLAQVTLSINSLHEELRSCTK